MIYTKTGKSLILMFELDFILVFKLSVERVVRSETERIF